MYSISVYIPFNPASRIKRRITCDDMILTNHIRKAYDFPCQGVEFEQIILIPK